MSRETENFAQKLNELVKQADLLLQELIVLRRNNPTAKQETAKMLENQLIYPKVVGSSIGLPGIWVFAAVMIGGGLFGIQGVIFGIPIVSVFYQLIKNDLNKREKNNILKKVQV